MNHVTKEFHQVHPKLFLSLWYVPQTVHLSCVKISTISKQTKSSVQNDFKAYGSLAQAMHLSCTDANTISKQAKTRFHMTHVT
jgi:hypothetical protein